MCLVSEQVVPFSVTMYLPCPVCRFNKRVDDVQSQRCDSHLVEAFVSGLELGVTNRGFGQSLVISHRL